MVKSSTKYKTTNSTAHEKSYKLWSSRFITGMQEWFNICKSINVICHIKILKDKNHIIIFKDAGKAYNKIPCPFLMKTLNKLSIEEKFLNLINYMYNKSITNIILNNEKQKAFLLRSGTRQVCPLSPLIFNIILEVTDRAIRLKRK